MSKTYKEIFNQAESWPQTVLAAPRQWREIASKLEIGDRTHVLLVGSGTSLYLAQSAAHALQEVTGLTSTAVPASEVFLSPLSVLPQATPILAFVISRSGTTSEALMAAAHLRELPNAKVVGVTCSVGTELARRCHAVLELPHAGEESIVMTQSFTNMLLALQSVASEIAGDRMLSEDLLRIPQVAMELLASHESIAKGVGSDRSIGNFIYLGLGPCHGLAEEASLKLKEMTQVACEAYNTLEFRHGPVSTLTGDTGVIMLESERERPYAADIEVEMKGYGAQVVTVSDSEPRAADRHFALPAGFDDVSRSVLYMPAMQMIAYYRALALGLDPDRPRLLSQVVVLNRS